LHDALPIWEFHPLDPAHPGRPVHQRLDAGAPFSLVTSAGSHEEHGGSVWWREDFSDHLRAVDVTPLQVVYENHQRRSIRDPPEHLPQGTEGATPELLRIRRQGAALWCLRDRFDPL